MKAFDNSTVAGNEKAIRKGKVVPSDDVNLAFYKAPELSPKENLVIVDTSRAAEDAVNLSANGCNLYYANEVGILVDEESNSAIADSSPAITDELLRDEDFSYIPGNEYNRSDVLPYQHRSRYFHLEKAGLSFAGLATSYDSESVKVVDKSGQEYSKYKIRLMPASIPGYSSEGDNWAYRILVYIDSANIEELYLVYNKVEIKEGKISAVPTIDYKEIINPRPFFKQMPEEADVVDPASLNKKIFASTPISADGVDIGRNLPPGVDGYKIHVPKKAIPDPRIYQVFRWRINVDFVQDSEIDPGSSVQTIKCGILKLSNTTSTRCDFALMNLSKSRFNGSGVDFVNPNATVGDKNTRSYWHVDLDKDDLTDYDILLMAPANGNIDITPYLPKLRDFVKNKGGTLFFDTWSRVDLYRDLGGILSVPVNIVTSSSYSSDSPITGFADADTLQENADSELINGNQTLGGWDIAGDVDHLTHVTFNSGRYLQFFETIAQGATSAVNATDNGKSVLMDRTLGNGRIIVSTMGSLLTTSALFDYRDNSMVGSNSNPISNPNYRSNINGEGVEGAYKILYNACLISTKSRVLDDSDESSFSSVWRYNSKWRGSWTINAFDDVLDDNEKQRYNFAIDAVDPDNGDFTPVWKRKLSAQTVGQIVEEELAEVVRNDPVLAARINESSRVYTLESTNPEVSVGITADEDTPQAWTTAYSPKFTVPENLAPYVVKEPLDEDGQKGIKPEFGPAQSTYTEYPDTPYGGKVRVVNATSEELATPVTTNYTVTGTATGTKQVVTENPDIVTSVPVTTASSVVKDLVWSQAHQISKSGKGSPTSTGTKFKTTSFPAGFIKPVGLRTWQDYNYKNSSFGNGNLLWPYMGFQGRLVRGSSGNTVKYVQETINRFRNAGYLSTSRLAVDGQYGSATATGVRNFQSTIGARYVDGVIDAETWWLLAAWIQRLYKDGKAGSNYLNYYDNSASLQMHRLSDGSNLAYAKRSWVKNGPSVVWDLIAITFDRQYEIEGVSITPWAPGAGDIMFRSVHVKNGNSLTNWSASNSFLKNMKHRPKDGQKFDLPFAKRNGDTIVLGIAQDKPYKSGSTSRLLGVRDISAKVKISSNDTSYQAVVEDGGTSVSQHSESFSFTYTKSVSVSAAADKSVVLTYPGGDGYDSVSNISFDNVTVSNSDVIVSLSGDTATFSTQVIQTAQGTDIEDGPAFPGGTYYSKTPEGVIDPSPEIGRANKREGIKLLCNLDGSPYGFPIMPISATAELTRHYMDITILPNGNGPDTYLSFYDTKDQEFITSASGQPEMSYLEYYSRGPQNVFIAVVSDYETTAQQVVPEDVDAPRIPYKMAMPVYGVCLSKGSQITLESPPDYLSFRDVWPIPVRTGQYRRKRKLRKRSQGKLPGYLASYQGSEVTAIYSVPEAALDPGSEIYGPGTQDVIAEQPKILSDDVIRVRQTPIYMTEKFVRGDSADPVVPVLRVYKRASTTDSWVQLQREEIRDYNVSTGEIFLRDKLTSTDPSLLKVDYTSDQPYHSMTVSRSGQKINLNVFVDMMTDYIGKPIYVYMVPHYVIDSSGAVIDASYTQRTLEITSSPDIFDPTSPTYNPLAVQLGVVYTTDATDIDKLALIDTRSRGGGARSKTLTQQEMTRILNESTSFWDAKNPPTVSYPKQGYIRVQLPTSVKTYMGGHKNVSDAVERNLTAGVGFKIDYV